MDTAPVMLGVMMIAAIFSVSRRCREKAATTLIQFSPRSRPGHDPEYIASFDSCR